MATVLKSVSEICRKNFVNNLHFLPLRTKMALARPILIDMARYKVEVFPNVVNVHEYNDCIECN